MPSIVLVLVVFMCWWPDETLQGVDSFVTVLAAHHSKVNEAIALQTRLQVIETRVNGSTVI